MKLANVNGRAALVLGDEIADVATASDGRFGPDPMALYDDWDAFRDFAATVTRRTGPLVEATLRNPVPRPRQVFAIGLNYRSHAEESGHGRARCAGGVHQVPRQPRRAVRRHRDRRRHRRLGGRARRRHRPRRRPRRRGRRLVARRRPHRRPGHQRPAPPVRRRRPVLPRQVPPRLRTDRPLDRHTRRAATTPTTSPSAARSTARRCRTARTSDLIFGVPQLVAELSAVLPLLPGDVIFTGTPAGVGVARKPPRFLQPGDTLETWIEGIGTIRNRIVEGH